VDLTLDKAAARRENLTNYSRDMTFGGQIHPTLLVFRHLWHL
jgi:hypothetical protein